MFHSLCTVPGGMTAHSPGATSRSRSPTRSRPRPAVKKYSSSASRWKWAIVAAPGGTVASARLWLRAGVHAGPTISRIVEPSSVVNASRSSRLERCIAFPPPAARSRAGGEKVATQASARRALSRSSREAVDASTRATARRTRPGGGWPRRGRLWRPWGGWAGSEAFISSGYSNTSIATPRCVVVEVHRPRAVSCAYDYRRLGSGAVGARDPVPTRKALGRELAARGHGDAIRPKGLGGHAGVESQRGHKAPPFVTKGSANVTANATARKCG